MSNSQGVKMWRKTTKERMVVAMGGSCQGCGYDKCHAALEMHHLDPSEKDFSFGKVTANPKAWPKIVVELKKCVLVCSNCHREIHAGVREVPPNRAMFDERYLVYRVPTPRRIKISELDPDYRKRPNVKNRKVDRPTKEDLEVMLWKETLVAIGKRHGVADTAVKKWCKTYDIKGPPRGYWRRREAGYSHEDALVSQARPVTGKRFITDDIAIEALRLRDEGRSYRDIGQRLGFGHWSIQQGIKRYLAKSAARAGIEPANENLV